MAESSDRKILYVEQPLWVATRSGEDIHCSGVPDSERKEKLSLLLGYAEECIGEGALVVVSDECGLSFPAGAVSGAEFYRELPVAGKIEVCGAHMYVFSPPEIGFETEFTSPPEGYSPREGLFGVRGCVPGAARRISALYSEAGLFPAVELAGDLSIGKSYFPPGYAKDFNVGFSFRRARIIYPGRISVAECIF